jgi:maltose alpha-D-glucosyltransferase / alpha-amylase
VRAGDGDTRHRATATHGTRPSRIADGEFGYPTVNVERQQRDGDSLLSWFQRALLILRECPEFGVGSTSYVDSGKRSVLALLREAPSGAVLAVTNLADKRATVDLVGQDSLAGHPVEVFSDHDYAPVDAGLGRIPLRPYGYRWFRLRRSIGGRAGSARSAV